MLKYGHAVLVVGLLLACSRPADAQWACNLFQGMRRDFIRNNSWPEPFVRADRDSVNLPMNLMAANGWRRQNLLCERHFEDNTKLNRAGEEQVQWILTSVPPQHRTIFVERGINPDVTASRVQAIQEAAMGILPDGQLAEVVEVNLSSDGSPADMVDLIHRKGIAAIPDPKLPAAKSDSGGGGGGGT